MVSVDIELRVRDNLGPQHIEAAARFARLAHKVEVDNTGADLGPHYDEVTSYAIGAVLAAAAALEANINEVIKDALDGAVTLAGITVHTIEQVWPLVDRVPLLERYQMLLRLQGQPQMPPGQEPHQSASLLIEVRNSFSHYKPEWRDEQARGRRLGDRLRGKFPFSPFIDIKRAPIFPTACMSHGLAAWATKTAQAYATDFAQRAGVKDRLTNSTRPLATEN